MRLSPKNPFEWKFLKIGSIAVCSFMKNFPNLQVCRHTSVPPSALNIKVVMKLARADMVKLLPRVNMEEPTLKISQAKKHIKNYFLFSKDFDLYKLMKFLEMFRILSIFF